MATAPTTECTHQDDWPWAQCQYETTQATTRSLAQALGVSQTAIMARATKYGWQRNKHSHVVQATATLLAQQVAKQTATHQHHLQALEKVNVDMQARLLMDHRTDIARARRLCMRLVDELEQVMDNTPHRDELGELMRAEDDRGRDRLNDAYRKVLSMPERVGTLRALADALKCFIGLQRQAFGITGVVDDPDQQNAQATAADTSGMDVILAKFSMVLQRSAPQAPVHHMGDIVDANPTS